VVTIRDVARAAGVSIATVSRVFNGSSRVSEETRKAVRSAASKLDYWPNSAARSLTTSRSQVLGVLLPDLFGEFFSEVIRGIDHAARREKLQILVSSSHTDTDALLAAARSMRGRIDGLIAMAPDKGSAKAIHQITRKFPVVLLNPRFATNGCPAISIANFEGARAMVNHLTRLGHRDLAMITGPPGNVDAEERLRGFRTGLADAGVTPRAGLEIAGDFTESSGYRAAIKILRRRPRPSAVFAANDYMAIGLLSALRDAGVDVPGDMAVTGFDDIAIAQYLNPPLTTVHVDAYELGEQAMRLWVESTRTPTPAPPSREVIPATLVVRNSCGSTQPRAAEARARRRWGVSLAQPASDAAPAALPRSRKSAPVTSRTRGRVLGGR
jgi:LacI family transcriptional regulator